MHIYIYIYIYIHICISQANLPGCSPIGFGFLVARRPRRRSQLPSAIRYSHAWRACAAYRRTCAAHATESLSPSPFSLSPAPLSCISAGCLARGAGHQQTTRQRRRNSDTWHSACDRMARRSLFASLILPASLWSSWSAHSCRSKHANEQVSRERQNICHGHTCLSISLYIYIYLSISLSISLSLYLSLSLHIYIYIYIYTLIESDAPVGELRPCRAAPDGERKEASATRCACVYVYVYV